jgi:hypothetical protein
MLLIFNPPIPNSSISKVTEAIGCVDWLTSDATRIITVSARSRSIAEPGAFVTKTQTRRDAFFPFKQKESGVGPKLVKQVIAMKPVVVGSSR